MRSRSSRGAPKHVHAARGRRHERASALVGGTSAIILFCATWPAAAGAQPTPKPAVTASASPVAAPPVAKEAPKDEAARLFEEATAAHDAGKLDEAEGLFLKAFALKQSWDVAANLGVVERKLGKNAAAAAFFADALRMLPPSEAEETRAGIERRLAAVRPEVGAVRLRVNVEGADVKVGGEARGKSPVAEAFVTPGRVTIEVTKDGYDGAKRTLEIKKGETQEISIELHAKEAPPPPPRSMVPAYVMGGVGAASLIAGAVLVGASVSIGSDMLADVPVGKDGKPTCRKTLEPSSSATAECDAWRARGVEAGTLGNVGSGFLIVAGIAAAGVAGYLLWPSRPAPRAATFWRVSPVVSMHGGGALLEGRF